MHRPENIDGSTYLELVAATSMLLSKNLSAYETYLLAEFLQCVSNNLITLANFKEIEKN